MGGEGGGLSRFWPELCSDISCRCCERSPGVISNLLPSDFHAVPESKTGALWWLSTVILQKPLKRSVMSSDYTTGFLLVWNLEVDVNGNAIV